MNLKLRLNLMITALLALVMAIGAVLTIRNARGDVQAEVESTANLALHLLDAEISHYTSAYAALNPTDPRRASIFRLQSLGNIRHLRIEFIDHTGQLRDSNQSAPPAATEAAPPRWFTQIMDVGNSETRQTRRKIFANGRVLGELVVTRDPSFEIAEVWDDTVGLLVLVAVLFVVINLLVYWAVGRALQPVDHILQALTEVERGRFDTRLPEFKLPELSSIGQKFNAMAHTLEQSVQSNRRLNQRIVRLQEDERKALARDLHDEIGQCLTAIRVDAMAIQGANSLGAAHASARAIGSVAGQLMDMVRDMLQRLRPGALDHLGLGPALRDLFDQWRHRNRFPYCSITLPDDLGPVDEAVAITAYRTTQECLTNISRHADPSRVSVQLARDSEALELRVVDDGRGFEPDSSTAGFGLAGMRERVEGLGGSLQLSTAPGRGTRVTVRMPCAIEATP